MVFLSRGYEHATARVDLPRERGIVNPWTTAGANDQGYPFDENSVSHVNTSRVNMWYFGVSYYSTQLDRLSVDGLAGRVTRMRLRGQAQFSNLQPTLARSLLLPRNEQVLGISGV